MTATAQRASRRTPRRWPKRLLPKSLLGRTLLILAAPAALAQAIAIFIFYDRHWETMSERLSRGVAGEIALTVERVRLSEGTDELLSEIGLVQRALDLTVAWRPDAILPNAPRPEPGALIDSPEAALGTALENLLPYPWTIVRSEEKALNVRVQLSDGVVDFRIPLRRVSSPTTYIFIYWMIGSSLVLVSVAALFMRNQVRPIRRLAVAAERFGRGLDSPHFKPEGALEVRRAAAAFVVMRDRIRRQIQQRTEMLAGVSHDLRTPLTRMKLQLAFLPQSADVDELKSDIAEMETMIEGYLAFARGEGGETPTAVDPADLLEEVIAKQRREGRDVALRVESRATMQLRRDAVRRCLANLVGNAVRYASHVEVSAARGDGVYEITVDDDGPGVPLERRDDVFRPFVRLDASRNRATGGVGLGLTIARDVARGHGGDVALDDSPLGGLRAVLRLPL